MPRPFVWLIPRYGRYTKAAILHDYLVHVGVESGALSRADADGIFRQAMRTLDDGYLRRWLMWAGVRASALTTPAGRVDWLRHSWQVLPLALVALPIVLPAAAVIIVSSAAFYLVECAVWLALHVVRRLRRQAGKPAKRVNKPSLNMRL